MARKLADKGSTKLILSTAIPGCDEKDYLNQWQKYCEGRGKKVKIFYAGRMMFEHAAAIGLELDKDNILNVDLDLLGMNRSAVFDKIIEDINDNAYDAVVVCVHSFFYWKKQWRRAYDKYLNRFSPDLYVTFIEDFRNIISRLGSRSQFKDENYTAEEVLSWQNVEVEVTCGWAEFAEKPYFAIPTGQPISTLYKLVFHPEIEPVYVAMPISHLRSPEDREPINRFVERIDQYFTVFNPLSVEVVGAIQVNTDKPISDAQSAINSQIVFRDLYWFVQRAKKIICYWPAKPVSSPGMNHETHEAFSKAKDVWTIFLGPEASPFLVSFSTKFFRSEEEFFTFLENKYPERKKFKW